MFLPPKEAAKLVNAALTPKTAVARMKASEKVLKAMTKIADDGPGLRWDDFQGHYKDAIEDAKQLHKGAAKHGTKQVAAAKCS